MKSKPLNRFLAIHRSISSRNLATGTLMAAIVVGATFSTAFATIRTWDGSTDSSLNTATNWSGDVAPIDGDQMLFDNNAVPSNLTYNATIASTSGLGASGVAGIRVAAAHTNALSIDNAAVSGQTLRAGTGFTFLQVDSGAGAVTFGNGSGSALNIGSVGTATSTVTLLNNSSNAVTFASETRFLVGGTTNGTATWTFDGTGSWQVDGVVANNGGTGTQVSSLTKIGTGTLTLNSANTYTGTTNLNGGTLALGNNAALGTGGLTLNATVSPIVRSADATARTIANNITLSLGATFGSIGTGDLLFTGTVTTGSATSTKTFTVNNAVTEFSGIVNGSSTASTLSKMGTGILVFSGANTYTKSTAIEAGVLNIRNALGLGAASMGTSVTSGAALELQHATGITVGAEALALIGTGISNGGGLRNISGANSYAGVISLGSASRINSVAGSLSLTGGVTGTNRDLTVGGAGASSITAITTGTGNLTKDGAGTLTLTGTSTYTGSTLITGGTLALGASGSITTSSGVSLGTVGTFDVSATGGYTVNNLSGSGTVFGALTVSTSLAIGNSPGTVFFNDGLTLTSGTTTTMELAGIGGVAGTDSDLASVIGTLTLDGALNIVSYNSYDTTLTAAYNLFDATIPITGDFDGVSVAGNALAFASDVWSGSFGGKDYTFSESTGILTVAAVPEPAAALLGSLGLLALLRRRRTN
jgi:fibronectin-binding autotransporter adhesin